MEDIFEEPVVDIDISDTKKPLAAVEYVAELYAYYKKMEVTNHFYVKKLKLLIYFGIIRNAHIIY